LKVESPYRYLLIGTGCISIVLGIIGIFLPLMPTTCFILLAAWCFGRSSEKCYSLLVNQKHLGPIVIAWEDNQGIEASARNRILFALWSGLILSMILVAKVWLVLALLIVGVSVSVYLVIHTRELEASHKRAAIIDHR